MTLLTNQRSLMWQGRGREENLKIVAYNMLEAIC